MLSQQMQQMQDSRLLDPDRLVPAATADMAGCCCSLHCVGADTAQHSTAQHRTGQQRTAQPEQELPYSNTKQQSRQTKSIYSAAA